MLRREGDGVAWYLAREAMFGRSPVPRSLVLTWTSDGDPAGVADGVIGGLRDGIGPGARLRAGRIKVERHLGDGVDGPWTATRQETALSLLAEDDVFRFTALWSVPDPEVDDVLLRGWRAGDGDVWSWRLTGGFGERDRLDAAAEVWQDLLEQLGRRSSTLWGAISHDRFTTVRTPVEDYLGIRDGELTSVEHPRGYYWSNLLTRRHLDRLGGRAAVESRAAELGLRTLALDCERLIVRSPGPVDDFDGDRMAAVRTLLDPVLVRRPYRYYAGPPLRVVKEPGTAFRRIPPEIMMPWFEDDGPMPEGGDAYRLVPDDENEG